MATLLKDHKWYKDNAADIGFLKAHETFDPMGARHAPVRHSALLQAFRDKAASLGLKLDSEQGALTNDGKRFNYVARIGGSGGKDYALECGFTNYNDRTRSWKGLLSSRVMICANGCLHGVVKDSIARHTKTNIENIGDKIDIVFDRFAKDRDRIDGQMQLLKSTKLTDRLIADYILALGRAKTIGSTHVLDVLRYVDEPSLMTEVQDPTLNSKDDDSAFRLLNAATYMTTHRIKNPDARNAASKIAIDSLMRTIQGDSYVPVGDVIDVETVAA